MTSNSSRRLAVLMAAWTAPIAASAVLVNESEATLAQLFPAAADAPSVDQSIKIEVGKGQSVVLTSVRFMPRPDQTEARNTFWCGVVIKGAASSEQALVTVGTGSTEAESCVGLSRARASKGNGHSPGIDLFYDTRSPNVSGSTVVSLNFDPGTSMWVVRP